MVASRNIEWVSTVQLATDSSKLASMLPADTVAIVGVPRSGLIAASIIATQLHLPLYQIFGNELSPLGFGSRGRFDIPNGTLVVVDDTVYSGSAIGRVRLAMAGKPTLFTAVYVNPQATRSVDLFARVLPSPHLLEWNMMNNGPWAGLSANPIYRGGVATDMDGIICHDSDVPDADDGPGLERYRQWLINAKPRWLPRAQPTRLIITARLEKFREETEAWLKRWRINVDRLIMHPADKASHRGNVAAWKAGHYAASNCGFFVESEPWQAAEIYRLTDRPVICPDIATVYGGAGTPVIVKPERVSVCRACGSANINHLWHDQDGWEWCRCNCGSDTSAAPYVPEYYSKDYVADLLNGDGNKMETAVINHEHNAVLFDKYIKAPGEFLDVGTGHGASQIVMQNRGWTVTGFDTCGEGRPANTVTAARFHAGLFDKRFNAVLCREVLEHVPDQHEFLQELYNVTAKNGVCQVTTPRPLSTSHEWRCYQARHLVLWNPDKLSKALRSVGFVELERETWELGQRHTVKRLN